ncbi:TPA: VirB3 family type IV secretion system protein [Legionella pneumophila]|nr:VirB3 family type IV secretion system protein [Legionella pneumophila]HDS3863226.1 VirB3 family type IV secretion system protein [Legionella pneumophila]
MSHEDDALDTHTVFGALTRPAMTAGVTLEYHGLNLMVSVCAFIAMGNLLYGLMFIPFHVFGWMICRHDARWFSTVLKWLKLPPMPNQNYWGVRSYEPF